MSHALQLIDYVDGYRIRAKCRHCGYGWHEEPAHLLKHEDMHSRMYLDEASHYLKCHNCKRQDVMMVPILIRKTHHFVAGLP